LQDRFDDQSIVGSPPAEGPIKEFAMKGSSEFARIRTGPGPGLALVAALAIAPVHASPVSPEDRGAPPAMSQCARLPSSERDICAETVSLASRDAVTPAQPSAAADASADPPGAWAVSEAVDAKFASTFRSVVTACGGPFQMELVDAQPQPEVRFRCVRR
jgi:hypothetical protein